MMKIREVENPIPKIIPVGFVFELGIPMMSG